MPLKGTSNCDPKLVGRPCILHSALHQRSDARGFGARPGRVRPSVLKLASRRPSGQRSTLPHIPPPILRLDTITWIRELAIFLGGGMHGLARELIRNSPGSLSIQQSYCTEEVELRTSYGMRSFRNSAVNRTLPCQQISVASPQGRPPLCTRTS